MGVFLWVGPLCVGAPVDSFNHRILHALSQIPEGGQYAVTRTAADHLAQAIQVRGGFLRVQPEGARPSYCSGATYLVFLMALERDIDALPADSSRDEILRLLRVAGQSDGTEVWGRWNANGPGTAKLLKDTGMGRSFWDWEEEPLPGDFLKLWWKDAIGRDEFGHSVIFLGYTISDAGEKGVEVWSSHKPSGYGRKFFPFSKIQHALFSRCEYPGRIRYVRNLESRDSFLADMLKKNFSLSEVKAVLR
jgi:hypothetical protein